MAEKTVPLTEAALRLGISRERALRELLRGRLVGAKVDGQWMLEERSLTRWLGATADRSLVRGVRA